MCYDLIFCYTQIVLFLDMLKPFTWNYKNTNASIVMPGSQEIQVENIMKLANTLIENSRSFPSPTFQKLGMGALFILNLLCPIIW